MTMTEIMRKEIALNQVGSQAKLQICERLSDQYNLTEYELDEISARGLFGRYKSRIWFEPDEIDRPRLGYFARIEMAHLNENGNPVKYD